MDQWQPSKLFILMPVSLLHAGNLFVSSMDSFRSIRHNISFSCGVVVQWTEYFAWNTRGPRLKSGQ